MCVLSWFISVVWWRRRRPATACHIHSYLFTLHIASTNTTHDCIKPLTGPWFQTCLKVEERKLWRKENKKCCEWGFWWGGGGSGEPHLAPSEISHQRHISHLWWCSRGCPHRAAGLTYTHSEQCTLSPWIPKPSWRWPTRSQSWKCTHTSTSLTAPSAASTSAMTWAQVLFLSLANTHWQTGSHACSPSLLVVY